MKKRFFVFIALLFALLAGTVALIVFEPWKELPTAADPFAGIWTARRVVYLQDEYDAVRLFPNGVPELKITALRVTLSFSGNTGKGWRRSADDTITFSCLDKTYTAALRDGVLTMDMNGMTIFFTQSEDADTQQKAQDGAADDDPLTGEWIASRYTSRRKGPGYATELFQSGCAILLNADGTGTVTVDTYTEQIAWTLSDNIVSITGTIMFPALSYRDGQLYGDYGRSGVTLLFIKPNGA